VQALGSGETGRAVRTLGAQWAYVARVTEGHRLVTEGPYRWVRNPIYSGMLGMMLATGLAVSSWMAFPIAIVVFGVGRTSVSAEKRKSCIANLVTNGTSTSDVFPP
jgi:protein-S-isoprenylcysteine O-methyltransferase Ste14